MCANAASDQESKKTPQGTPGMTPDATVKKRSNPDEIVVHHEEFHCQQHSTIVTLLP